MANHVYLFFQNKLKSNNSEINANNKCSLLSEDNPYFYKDSVSYNTSVAKAIIQKLESDAAKNRKATNNGNQKKDHHIMFECIINMYDNYSALANETTRKELKNLVKNQNIIDVHYEGNYSYNEILKEINKNYKFIDYSTVHICTNGGDRNMQLFLSLFTQVLEFKGITTRFYFEKPAKNGENDTVVEIKHDFFNVLHGVELFRETGNPTRLIRAFNQYKSLENLTQLMTVFNEKIQICRKVDYYTENESDLLSIYNQLIRELENLDNDNNDNEIPPELKIILPNIKNTFQNKKWNISPQDPHNPPELGLLNIIKWCHDNNLITIGYFIFRVEMAKFIDRCTNYLTVNFKDGQDLPIYSDELNKIRRERREIRKSKHDNDNEYDFDPEKKSSVYYRYINAKTTSDRLDALMILFVMYITDKHTKVNVNGTEFFEEPTDEQLKDYFEKFGIELTNNDVRQTYRIILICNLIRIIRNSLAHPDNKFIVRENKYLKNLVVEYQERFRKDIDKNDISENIKIKSLYPEGYGDGFVDIVSGDANYYQVCYVLLGFLYKDMYEHYKNTRRKDKK